MKGKYIFLSFAILSGCAMLTKTVTVPGPTVYIHDSIKLPPDTLSIHDTSYLPGHVTHDTLSILIPYKSLGASNFLDTIVGGGWFDPIARVVYETPTGKDDWPQIQGATNYCQIVGCRQDPANGFYHFSKPILVVNRQGNDYGQSFIDISGPTNAQNTPIGQCAVFIADFGDAPLFVLQQAKGSTIKNLVLYGQYDKSIGYGDVSAFTQMQVDTLQRADWFDTTVACNVTAMEAGIDIDPFSDPKYFDSTHKMYPRLLQYYLPGMSRAGSTAVHIEGCYIGNFVVGIMITNGMQFNGEMIKVTDCQITGCLDSYVSTQGQSDMNTVSNLFVWGGTHTIFSGGYYWGMAHTDAMAFPTVDHVNIASTNYQFVCGAPINKRAHFSDIYAENIFRIGSFGCVNPGDNEGAATYYTRTGVAFTNSYFNFGNVSGYPIPNAYVEGAGVEWENCTLTIYNGNPATGRIIFVDDDATFRDGVFAAPPIALKTAPTAIFLQGPLITNARRYDNTQAKLPETGKWEVQTALGNKNIFINRTNFTGYIIDSSARVQMDDYLLTQRLDYRATPYPAMNTCLQIGHVYKIADDTIRFDYPSQDLHTGEALPVFIDRIKF